MKKNDLKLLKDMSKVELQKEVVELKNKMALLKLENSVNAPKDVNVISNMKKKLAVILTIINKK